MPAADLQFQLLGPKIPCHNRSPIEIASEGDGRIAGESGRRRKAGETAKEQRLRSRKARGRKLKRRNDSSTASTVFFSLALPAQVALVRLYTDRCTVSTFNLIPRNWIQCLALAASQLERSDDIESSPDRHCLHPIRRTPPFADSFPRFRPRQERSMCMGGPFDERLGSIPTGSTGN